jgi:cell division control protein 7
LLSFVGTFSTVYKALDVRRDLYDNSDWEPQLLSSPISSPKAEETNNSKTIYDYVALKRIYHTSSPRRIANEIAILRRLKGSPCISPLITAFRQQDQVFVVMPYIQHDDFKRNFNDMSMLDIKCYLKSLFTALEHLHKHKILHRDVKPNNFLYSRRKKTGYLIDFGLAEVKRRRKKYVYYYN